MKRVIFIAIGVLFIAVMSLVIYTNKPSNLSDQEIRQKFACDRITTDARPTDKYCGNPELYRSEQ